MLTRVLARLREYADRGFTLIEVIVATTIVASVAATVASVAIYALRAETRINTYRVVAMALATEVERLQSTPWNDLLLSETGKAGCFLTSTTALSPNATRFSAAAVRPQDVVEVGGVEITITRKINWYADGTEANCTNLPNTRADLKEITVIASWEDTTVAPTRMRSRSTTILSSRYVNTEAVQ